MGRTVVVAGAAALMVLAAACTPASPARSSAGRSMAASPAVTRTTGPANAAALAQQGLLVPASYQQACAHEGSICLTSASGAGSAGPGPAGPIPAVLNRPLHFPALRPGQRCPASRGSPVSTDLFGGIALGDGPVRVIIADAGDVRHGVADLGPTSAPPWLGLKTYAWQVDGLDFSEIITVRAVLP